MGSAFELNISVGVTTVDCYRLRMVADMSNVECSWVQLLSSTSRLVLRFWIVKSSE